MKREDAISLCKALLIWGIALLVCWFLSGCKTQVITVPEYHTVIQTDTVNTTDSIFIKVRETVKGDVVYRDSIVYRDRWRERVVEKIVTDSVVKAVPVEVEKVVYKRSGYDTFTSWFFWITIVLLILAAAWWTFQKFYLRR